MAAKPYLSLAKLYAMSDEDLQVLSLQKNPRGCATVNAIKAQREIVRRNGGDAVAGHHRYGLVQLSDEGLYADFGEDFHDQF